MANAYIEGIAGKSRLSRHSDWLCPSRESHRNFLVVILWTEKLSRNHERDKRDLAALLAQGWRILWIWECYFKKHKNNGEDAILKAARSLIEMKNIHDETSFVELPSRQSG